MTTDEITAKAGKLRHVRGGAEYDLPNVPRYSGVNAVATSATADGVLVTFGLRSVLLTVDDARRLADYLREAADWVG
jgi:hypothetical protein